MSIATKIFLYGGFLALLFVVSLQNYLLFHSLAELFSIVIAFGIFVIGWNSRKYYKNNYLLFIGIAYLFVAFFDTLHTLAYKGMNVFHGYDDNNLPPQLWLVARYMESIALLLAPTFFSKPVRHWRIISVLTIISALAIYAIFFTDIFPVCFVTGSGLTPFKVGSEYLIDLILCAALYMLYRYKEHFEPGVVKLLTLSIGCTMVTELCFTVYVHLYGISNLVGHFFKIFSFWFMYKAIIETALRKPYDLLFRELRTSEKQFSNAFHFAPIGIALVAPNGGWLKVNRAVCAMLGYTEEELLSKTFQDITHPDDLKADLDQVRQMLDGPIASYQSEKRYVHKNGSTIWVLRSTSLVRDDDGNPQHFIAQIIDITERKLMEDRLSRTSEQLQFVLDGSQQGFWDWNIETGEVARNERWAEMLGYTLKEVEFKVKQWTDLIHPDDRERAWTSIKNHIEGLTPFYEQEYRMLTKDGEYKWILDRARIVQRDAHGKPARMSGTHTDITRLKLSEEELQAKNTEMERFAYTVSHDLKSPLITIQIYAGMILKNMEAGKYERAIGDMKRIEDAASKMNALLGDLLELSRAGRQMSEPAQVDMNRLVKDTLTQLAGSLKQNQVEVSVQPDLPAVHGDHKRISEIVQNLIENAIKYRGDQSAPRIEIGVRLEAKESVFFVSDNGIGIDPRQHERIFGLFNKLDTKSEGTGVGLALVKRFIEVHRGRVWVESDGVGMGSTFCFTVPKKL